MINAFPILSEQSQKKEDERGALQVLYETDKLILKRSFSKKGVFRGLHLQLPPSPQTKLIRVISGKIIDFVVEPKNNEGEVHWREIDENADWVLIQAKYAHGFYALEDTVFEYICDGAYNETAEEAYSISDFLKNTMNIKDLILSTKDANAQLLKIISE